MREAPCEELHQLRRQLAAALAHFQTVHMLGALLREPPHRCDAAPAMRLALRRQKGKCAILPWQLCASAPDDAQAFAAKREMGRRLVSEGHAQPQ
jgi:hypothetical protein